MPSRSKILYSTQFGAGSPLVILHGLFGSSDNWKTIAQQLSSQYQVTCLDLRNHGQSFHDPIHTYDAMCEDVHLTLQYLGIRECLLIGHSMGGKVAMTVASKYTDCIAKLVVVDIAPKVYSGHHQNILDGLLNCDPTHAQSRSEIDTMLTEYVKDPLMRLFLLKGIRQDEGVFKWVFNVAALQQQYAVISGVPPLQAPIHIPTCFIKGARSDYISFGDYDDIKHYFPQSQIITIPDAGHWLHAEQAERFLVEVTQFLNNNDD